MRRTVSLFSFLRPSLLGGVGAEHAYWRISWTALTLEVGKSRPGCAGVAPRSAICEFASSGRALADPPTVRFSTTGANRVSRTKKRARDPLLVPALPALATPSICWLRSAAASVKRQPTPWRSIHAAPRLCAPLPAALPEPQSSRILRAACAQPAAQSPGDGRTCASSYGVSWASSLKKKGFGENAPRAVLLY